MQKIQPLPNGAFWIEGQLEMPSGGSGPLVIGPDWLLEMIRSEDGHAVGFYWAPFSIVSEIPKMEALFGGRFVGYSKPGNPPATWLTRAITFDLGDAPLAHTPEELLHLIAEQRPHHVLDPLDKSSTLSRKARRLIARGYSSDVGIAGIARELGVSHAHLARQFKKDFGITPINYLHHIRVTDAMARLSRGQSAVDIGYDVGFNDTARFYKDFRKVTGTSPGQCRNSREAASRQTEQNRQPRKSQRPAPRA
jgi:AraC-like DNA-binding protein